MAGYAFNFENHGVFTPEGKQEISNVSAHNAAVEAEQLAIWASKPDRCQVYVTKKDGRWHVGTWLGTSLGTILSVSAFSTNLSRKIMAIRFRGTNGATYYGRFGADWSELCRVRKCK